MKKFFTIYLINMGMILIGICCHPPISLLLLNLKWKSGRSIPYITNLYMLLQKVIPMTMFYSFPAMGRERIVFISHISVDSQYNAPGFPKIDKITGIENLKGYMEHLYVLHYL